jgi:ElaB/YqjD/DUF883 family membrane-anchored ribosome-binding protein
MEDGGRSGAGTPEGMRRQAEQVAVGVDEQLEGVRGYAQDAAEFVREFARERPFAAVAIAAAVGFVLGRLLSRT